MANLLLKCWKGVSLSLFGPCCRFQPTCSEYFFIALKSHGIIGGFYLFIRRFLRCHPYGSSGYDPVPEKLTDKK